MSGSMEERLAQWREDNCNSDKISDVFVDMPEFGEYWETECSGVSDFYQGEEEGDYVASNLFMWASNKFFNHAFLLKSPIELLAINKVEVSLNAFNGGGHGSISTFIKSGGRFRGDFDLIGYTQSSAGIKMLYRYDERNDVSFEGMLEICDNDGDWIITGDSQIIQLRRKLNKKLFIYCKEEEVTAFYKLYIENLIESLRADLTEVNVLKHVEMFFVSEDIWRFNKHKNIESSFLEIKKCLTNLYHNVTRNTLEDNLNCINQCSNIINQM